MQLWSDIQRLWIKFLHACTKLMHTSYCTVCVSVWWGGVGTPLPHKFLQTRILKKFQEMIGKERDLNLIYSSHILWGVGVGEVGVGYVSNFKFSHCTVQLMDECVLWENVPTVYTSGTWLDPTGITIIWDLGRWFHIFIFILFYYFWMGVWLLGFFG